MTRRDLFLLFIIGSLVSIFIAQFQTLPGYMDADYYFGGGLRLVQGHGFSEPYLWNYLADPQSLPAPSHAYWFPLASIVAAAGMWVTGQASYAAARLGFVLLAAVVAPFTATLAFRLTSNRGSSFLSGLLACFSIYYAPFLPATDNYAIYMLVGASFFLLLSTLQKSDKNIKLIFFGFGGISALAALARSDGLLWLGMSGLVAFWYAPRADQFSIRQFAASLVLVLAGFLLLTSPWYARNLSTFGTPMAPGGSRALWLTNYNDTFAYPASTLTFRSWLASGWDAILRARVAALLSPTSGNLLNAFGAQGGIFLFPFILIGLWKFRRDTRVRLAVLAWLLLLFAMTVVFPFAGPRGAFFHGGAALQPMWWSLAPVGLDALITFARSKNLFDDRAFIIFRGALVAIAVLMTAVIFIMRVLPGWAREDGQYLSVENHLVHHGARSDSIVVVSNPPGYYVVTGRSAIVIPNGGLTVVLAAADQFGADYLVLEPDSLMPDLNDLYNHPDQFPDLAYLGETDGIRVFKIAH
jgi:4-amino-4-deoxy-L-arabinose transferase-like glycosyltransferase